MRKLIVVTGGSRGIGRAILERFAEAEFDLATCARNEEGLNTLTDDFRKVYPSSSLAVFKADMSEKLQVKAFTDFVAGLGRPVDVLVNNSGYFLPGEICTEQEGTLERMIHANLYSAYYTTRGLAHLMKARRSGHIFNICSIASLTAYPNGGSYAISKAAMLGFSRCLREELKDWNIRVTAVLPGATRTRSWDGTDLPEERFMKAEDVAQTVFGAWSLSPTSVVEEVIIRPQQGDI